MAGMCRLLVLSIFLTQMKAAYSQELRPEIGPETAAPPSAQLSIHPDKPVPRLASGVTITVDADALGRSIAYNQRKAIKEERVLRAIQYKKDHPKVDRFLTVIGWRRLDKNFLLPVSDWWADHEGLGIGAGAASSTVTMGLVAGGAARK